MTNRDKRKRHASDETYMIRTASYDIVYVISSKDKLHSSKSILYVRLIYARARATPPHKFVVNHVNYSIPNFDGAFTSDNR